MNDPGTLRIEICDTCLVERKDRILDSKSGKWAPFEIERPPHMKGDRVRIYEREDGTWVCEEVHESGWSVTSTGTKAEVIERLAQSTADQK